MINRSFQQLRRSDSGGTRLASSLLAVVLSLLGGSLVGCLVTDKLEFRVVPPNVRAVVPSAAVERLPTASADFDCVNPSNNVDDPEWMSFSVEVSDSLINAKVESRVFVNGEAVVHLFNSVGVVNGEVFRGVDQFCLVRSAFDGDGNTCNRVEVLVSHGFQGFASESVRKPLVEGDIDSVTWWVSREPILAEDADSDTFARCVEKAERLENMNAASEESF
jgi:hypothetical protein